MASTNTESDDEEPEIEDKFLKVATWAIASVKIIGHFPYTIQKRYIHKSHNLGKLSRLTLRYISWPIIYSLILMIIFLTWLLNYYIRLRSKLRFRLVFGPTENLAYTFMILSTSIARIHTQIRSLIHAKRTLIFWRKNLHLLQKFQNAGYNFDGQWFRKLGRESWWIFFICTVSVIIQTSYVHLYAAIYGSKQINTVGGGKKSFWPMPPDNEERFGSGLFWTSINYLRVANCWLVFFIRLYTVLLQQIELDSYKNSIAHPPKIFLTELTSLKNIRSMRSMLVASKGIVENHSIFDKLFQLKKASRQKKMLDSFATRPFLENRAETNLKLFVDIRKIAREFNEQFGMEIIWDVEVVTNVTIYFFFSCFWLMKGYVAVILDVGLPLILYTGKVVLWGWVCGKLGKNSREVIPAILTSVKIHELDIETQRKLRIWKIAGELNPVTISGKGFFFLDASFITSMFSGVSAFLVTLVEFRLAERR